MSETRSWFSRLMCFIGCHKWDCPGGECEDCGYPDTLFDEPNRAISRFMMWNFKKRLGKEPRA